MKTMPGEPSAGGGVSASWMKDLMRYIRSITPVAGPGVRTRVGPNGTVISVDAREARGGAGGGGVPGPFPWQVQWDPALGGEAGQSPLPRTDGQSPLPRTGNWKVYLPAMAGSGGKCLAYRDSYIDHADIGGLTRIGDGPWYEVDLYEGAPLTAIWLRIMLWKDDDAPVTVDVGQTPGQAAGENDPDAASKPYHVVNVCIAEVDAGTGTVAAQCVVGALHIGTRAFYV